MTSEAPSSNALSAYLLPCTLVPCNPKKIESFITLSVVFTTLEILIFLGSWIPNICSNSFIFKIPHIIQRIFCNFCKYWGSD